MKIKGYKDMRVFFYIKDNLIETVTFLPAMIQNYGAIWNDVDEAPLKYDYIKPYISEDTEGKLNRLICPECGTHSFMLDRYRFSVDLGPVGYGGDVSVCPDCNRVVEVVTDTRYRFDNDHKPEEVAFPPAPSEDKKFGV